MNDTKIEWCDKTLNPVVGCTFGCPYCYAKRINDRFRSQFGFAKDFSKPEFFPDRLNQLNYKKPQNIFMDSMSDIADWGMSVLEKVFEATAKYPQHNYLFLTKRPLELAMLMNCNRDNHWFGVSMTQWDDIDRVRNLENWLDVKKRFISFEPLLGPTHINFYVYKDFNWFIIGAETGNRPDKIIPKKEWVDEIVGFAQFHNIPVYMKESLLQIMGEENMLREFPKELIHENN
jgi:protein gp37